MAEHQEQQDEVVPAAPKSSSPQCHSLSDSSDSSDADKGTRTDSDAIEGGGKKASLQRPKKPRLMANYDSKRQEEIRLANRHAARECRKRKKMFNEELETAITKLTEENQALTVQHHTLTSCLRQVIITRQQQQQQPALAMQMMVPQVLQQQVLPGLPVNAGVPAQMLAPQPLGVSSVPSIAAAVAAAPTNPFATSSALFPPGLCQQPRPGAPLGTYTHSQPSDEALSLLTQQAPPPL
eukprot:CAMPEP_0198264402 /NCGR_PEP_ID=MMETSP1447-20131203/15683_1 /TAXON_ID=420782 /ORGANISM="Chaetoceros dichaeta, Strain CCMP1751" /LENGTH=237 /DNA_ID=CAMNT_0043953333 /DNA_START=67 /DNA_END=780 /DNA_ORIENTATION=+